MILPLAKLGSLVIKQLTKPVANQVKRSVKSSEAFARVIRFPAQGYHRLEQTVRMNLLGWNKKVDIKPLSNEAAAELGAELVGEFVVFSIAVAILYAETKRSQNKDQAKENAQNAKLQSLQEQITALARQVEIELLENRNLKRSLDDLTSKIESKN